MAGLLAKVIQVTSHNTPVHSHYDRGLRTKIYGYSYGYRGKNHAYSSWRRGAPDSMAFR
jgi:hypothetical protein